MISSHFVISFKFIIKHCCVIYSSIIIISLIRNKKKNSNNNNTTNNQTNKIKVKDLNHNFDFNVF